MDDTFEIVAMTSERLDDLAELFATNATTRGCWCMYHIATAAEFRDGYGEDNRAAFEALALSDDAPTPTPSRACRAPRPRLDRSRTTSVGRRSSRHASSSASPDPPRAAP